MKKLSGAEMVVQSLKDEGVEYVFGYPGGSVLDIYDAIHTLGLNRFSPPRASCCTYGRRLCSFYR